ncbi:pyridoxamine 5'-phosphate oxidase family protein [Sinanaerobacter sp. ZZT-01]|uniref:pyridoxamine 5'-phosphate oxidase family protein n=1 Tax=Sinanaerobacter sp. ZZT-01 TaxID=3111540 RepID=UPI002D79433A|nr:pyridoxamine 5'-phosphate oxidase family protein [Sinanaerobacter sp. ZZT-01]WRR93622.1 pyridoxamine 5'-phosphate oxidase family protein [Sinanaerobacter sp. ZZT-01]
MFREMRRKEKQLATEETIQMLERTLYGTLALLGDGGYPYSLPISFAYKDNKIYFHGAMQGHKIDAIKKEPKVSLSVVEKNEVLPEKFDTLYRSAIVFGKARVLSEPQEKREGLLALIEKYSSEYMQSGQAYIEKALAAVSVMEIEIEHMTGKEGK